MWLNLSVVILNVTLQLLVVYRYRLESQSLALRSWRAAVWNCNYETQRVAI